ncbi:hypothetical protein Tco_0946345, partial [Tanacetum coccineum]
ESGLEMASIQGRYVVHATTTTTPAIQNATTDVPQFSSSHSISSNYTSAFLNLENLHSTKPEVVSMLDINVQHEVPHTSPLLTIPVFVIPEHIVFNPSKTVIIASATTISSLLSSLFPSLKQSTPIPTPTTTEATTSTNVVLYSETLIALHQRIIELEKDVKELKDVDNSTKVILTIKFEVLNVVKEYLRSSLDDVMHMVIQRNFADIIKEHPITDETIERLRQQYASKKSILEDKDAMEKETKTSKKASTIKDSSKVKSPATSSKSSKSGKSAKDQVVEQIFIQDSNNAEHDDAELNYADMLIDQGEDLGNTDEQPKNVWYKNSSSDSSLDHEWNEGKSVDDGPEQNQQFDKEILVGPAYNLLKGTYKSYVELDYTMEECYSSLSEQLDRNNPEGHHKPLLMQMTSQASMTKSKAARYELQGIEDMVPNLWSLHDVYLTKRILSVISVKVNEQYGYGHLEEIVVKRADQQLYTFKDGKGRRASVGSRKLPEEAQPHQAKNSRYELHKFSDGTFTSVHDTLSQMLHDLHLGYNKVIKRRQWTRLDQQRTRIMIKAINQNLLERRIMRSLEKFVGGREYGEDL